MAKTHIKTLITGGAGFLGSHLCDFLLDQGHEVYCVDNFCTGQQKNIEHIKSGKFHFMMADVCTGIPFSERFDFILHFASPASPVDYYRLPIETLRVGSVGTYNCLEMAKKFGSRFLIASTSEVYGDPLEHPQKETYWGNVNPIGPRSVYDEAKRFSEAITMAYRREFKVNTGILRIFNTYGPRMRLDDGRAIPNFLAQALRGDDMTVYGDGKQTRSFCYVSDLVDGIFKLLLSDVDTPVNIGNPNELSILEMAEKIKDKTNSKSRIVFKPMPVDDPKVRKPDISKATSVLGWKPKVALDEGLKPTVDFFKNEIS